MKQLKFISVLGILTVISACGKTASSPSSSPSDVPRPNSVDADGNCTNDFVTKFNHVGTEAEALTQMVKNGEIKEKDDSFFQELIKQSALLNGACNQFFSEHDNVVCNQDQKTTASADLKSTCESVQEAVNGNVKGEEPKPVVEVECSPRFVRDYLQLNKKLKDIFAGNDAKDNVKLIAALKSADKDCKDFFAVHQVKTCATELYVGLNKKKVSLNTDKMKTDCISTERYLKTKI